MKRNLLVLVVCLVLAGCVARSGAKSMSERMGPREVDLQLTLVESYIRNGDYHRAMQGLLEVQDKADKLSRFHFDIGMTYMGLRELEKSRDGFARATEIDEDFGEAWNNLGKVQEGLQLYSEAAASYQQAYSILTYRTPEFASYNLGALYMRQGRSREAEEAARKALVRNWRYIPAYKLLSESLRAQGRLDEAEDVLKKGMAADMNDVEIMMALGELQIRMGKNNDAREVFQTVATKFPQSDEAKVARDYMDFLQ